MEQIPFLAEESFRYISNSYALYLYDCLIGMIIEERLLNFLTL